MDKGGMIGGLIMGIAGLVITIIVAFILVSNVALVDDDINTAIPGYVVNETSAFINDSGYSLVRASLTGFASPVITAAFNSSDNTDIIILGNITVSSAGVIINASEMLWGDVIISYSYTSTPTVASADDMISNFTSGIGNVSAKIPTVLLIAAVVLILGLLVLLWAQYQKMGVGSEAQL